MSRPSVAVVIPWRPSPGRERNLAACMGGLKRVFGEYAGSIAQVDVMLADSHGQPFSRAGSRNIGVRDSKADVVVVLDADAIVEQEPVHSAIRAAADGRLHLPYTAVRLLTQAGSETILSYGADPAGAEAWFTNTQSVGGCVVVAYETWRAVGGWDERFIGWGFEDTAFWAAVDTLYGTVRHHGTLHDLWHPDGREIGSARYQAGQALCERYTSAQGNPVAMRRLIEERACASV